MNKRTSAIHYLIPRLQDLVFIIFFYLLLILGTRLFQDGDPGRHIVFGRYILENLHIPTHDIFSFTIQGALIPPYAWLAEVVFGAGYMVFGLNGVVLVCALILAITFVLVFNELLRRGTPRLFAFGLTFWIAAITALHWLARPHLFSILFLVILTPRLSRLANGEKVPLWQFPLILLLWANTHGAFITAFLIWGAFIVANIWENWSRTRRMDSPILRRLLFTGGISFLATFVNPVGWRLYSYLLGYISNRYLVNLTNEYRPPDFHQPVVWPFLLAIGMIIFILSRSSQKRPLAESLLLAGWAALGIYGARNVPLFAVVAMPMLAEHINPFFVSIPFLNRLNHSVDGIEIKLRGAIWPLLVVIIAGLVLASGYPLDADKQGYQFNTTDFPVQALDWIENHPQSGNMFNYFPWGGYLIYRLWPEYLVFMDGQLFYGEELIRQHQQVMEAQTGWEQVLAQHNIQWILVPTEARIAPLLKCDPDWQLVYEDNTAGIFRKN